MITHTNNIPYTIGFKAHILYCVYWMTFNLEGVFFKVKSLILQHVWYYYCYYNSYLLHFKISHHERLMNFTEVWVIANFHSSPGLFLVFLVKVFSLKFFCLSFFLYLLAAVKFLNWHRIYTLLFNFAAKWFKCRRISWREDPATGIG